MAARTLRRRFAAPFVITVAALPLAHADKPAPPPRHPEERPTLRNPPPPKNGPKTYPHDRRWRAERSATAKDSCVAYAHVECPPPGPDGSRVTCNPPPPATYKCAAGELASGAQPIIQRKGSTVCMVEHPPVKCPAGAQCNPPRPVRVTCPPW